MSYDHDDYDKVAFGTSNNDFLSQKKEEEMIFFDGQIVWNENSCVVNGNIANFYNEDFMLDSLELWQLTNEFLHKICGYFDEEKGKFAFVGGEMNTKVNENIFKETVRLLNKWNTVFKKTDDNYFMLTLWARKICKHCNLGSFEEAEVELEVSKKDEDEREENEFMMESSVTQQAINDLIEVEEEEEEGVDRMLEITDGVALFEHLFSLPPNRATYGRVQVINGVCRILKNHKLRVGYDNHMQVMNSKLDKKGKFSITTLNKRNLATFINGMAAHIDAVEFVDLWRVLSQTIQSALRETMLKDKPIDKRVPIETQRWAFVAHLMADTSLHGLFSEIQSGPDRVEQHNEGGFQEWYLQKYTDVLKLGNVDSYTNEWEDKNFKWTHPKTEETRTRNTPLKGIDPKVGVITDAKQLQQIRTQMMNEYDKLTTMMCASGNNEMSMDRIMFYCTKGSCFQTKLFYVACVLMNVDTQFKSKRAYGTSTGITLEDAEKEGEDDDPHLMTFTNDSSSRKKRKRKSDSSSNHSLTPSFSYSAETINQQSAAEEYDQQFLRFVNFYDLMKQNFSL